MAMNKPTIQIYPVGLNEPTRFDLVATFKNKKFFLGYTTSNSQAEIMKKALLNFANTLILSSVR